MLTEDEFKQFKSKVLNPPEPDPSGIAVSPTNPKSEPQGGRGRFSVLLVDIDYSREEELIAQISLMKGISEMNARGIVKSVPWVVTRTETRSAAEQASQVLNRFGAITVVGVD